MNRQELINKVSGKADISKTAANKAIEAMLEGIKEALEKGESLQLTGYGTFKTKVRAARTGVNPQSGKKIQIPEKKVPAFVPGKLLREAVK